MIAESIGQARYSAGCYCRGYFAPMTMATELTSTDLLGSGCTAAGTVGALTVSMAMVAVHTAVMATTESTTTVKQIWEMPPLRLNRSRMPGRLGPTQYS